MTSLDRNLRTSESSRRVQDGALEFVDCDGRSSPVAESSCGCGNPVDRPRRRGSYNARTRICRPSPVIYGGLGSTATTGPSGLPSPGTSGVGHSIHQAGRNRTAGTEGPASIRNTKGGGPIGVSIACIRVGRRAAGRRATRTSKEPAVNSPGPAPLQGQSKSSGQGEAWMTSQQSPGAGDVTLGPSAVRCCKPPGPVICT